MYPIINCYFSDDDNRIALKPLDDVSDCQRDYINACYVDVSLFLLATQNTTAIAS